MTARPTTTQHAPPTLRSRAIPAPWHGRLALTKLTKSLTSRLLGFSAILTLPSKHPRGVAFLPVAGENARLIATPRAMFKLLWDKPANGVRLTLQSPDDALAVAPRPVFHEELDLLGLPAHGKYNSCHCLKKSLLPSHKPSYSNAQTLGTHRNT
ncbi:MAG: hypothetical protein LBT53_07310 [Puniceicoccales bacterium]|nr:hypothetical protein [Puniceicoccales bacterium]